MPEKTTAFKRRFGDKTATIVGLIGDFYSDDLAAGGGETEIFTRVFEAVARPGFVSIDVGANIGATTAIMATICPDSTVVSLEPSKAAYECLKKTAALNHGPKYHLLNVGAGGENGQATFVQDNASIAASFVSADLGGETVEIRTVDSVVKELALDGVDFIKIDVEGFEPNVLDGMKSTCSQPFIPLIYMEFNSWALASNGVSHMPFLKRILDDFRYFVYWDRSTRRPVSVKTVAEARTFLHENMVKNGCVDDIVFSRDLNKMKTIWSASSVYRSPSEVMASIQRRFFAMKRRAHFWRRFWGSIHLQG